jgi:hypothetical protein
VIGQSENGVVAVRHAVAYSTGAVFDFVAGARGLSRSQVSRVFHEQHLLDEEELPDSLLRIGFEFSDGSRVSNLGGWRAYHADAEPDEPLLVPSGGAGGSAGDAQVSLQPGYWLWPLPPSGPLRIACEWPLVEIGLTSIEIDGSALIEAAGRSADLWSRPPA